MATIFTHCPDASFCSSGQSAWGSPRLRTALRHMCFVNGHSVRPSTCSFQQYALVSSVAGAAAEGGAANATSVPSAKIPTSSR